LDPLRRILLRAVQTRKVNAAAIDWRKVRTVEAKEGRAGCELSRSDERKLFAHLRADLHPIVQFATLYGVRMGVLSRLQWRQVHFDAGIFRVPQKTNKPGVHCQEIPLTPSGGAILLAQHGRHKQFVWT
jgi:integrase